MKMLKKMGFTGLRQTWASVALAAACALSGQAIASANGVAASANTAVASVSIVGAAETPRGILASGQIHKRTTPAISLANTPEQPFFFKSWFFALLTVLIVIAVKRPWNTSTAKSLERRAGRPHGMIAPLVRS